MEAALKHGSNKYINRNAKSNEAEIPSEQQSERLVLKTSRFETKQEVGGQVHEGIFLNNLTRMLFLHLLQRPNVI